jgi:glycosyltransferase involved in cell wall biosynthesis
MYLLATHIPIYVAGDRRFLDAGWFPDVMLARDWLAPPFGELTVIAPWVLLETEEGFTEVPPSLGVRLVPAFDGRCRARKFWSTEARRWGRAVVAELSRASVLHTTMDDVFRPMAQLAFVAAARRGVPTVLVGPDMDPHEVLSERLKGTLRERVGSWTYLSVFDGALRHHLGRADLALLKQGAVFDRYAPAARNAKAFCHSMHREGDVIGAGALDARLSSRAGTLRLVYCGRLVRRKGMRVAVEAVALARSQGIPVELDVIGGGPEQEALTEQAATLGIGAAVRFHGQVPYGPDLLRSLASYDAMLYAPLEEDTPRMLYDGYAAGLPFLGAEIPFVRTRIAVDGAGIPFTVGDPRAAASAIAALAGDPPRLGDLSRRARTAGLVHAVESWYRRRSEWTREAVDASRRGRA